jgi:hypothetical protein
MVQHEYLRQQIEGGELSEKKTRKEANCGLAIQREFGLLGEPRVNVLELNLDLGDARQRVKSKWHAASGYDVKMRRRQPSRRSGHLGFTCAKVGAPSTHPDIIRAVAFVAVWQIAGQRWKR